MPLVQAEMLTRHTRTMQNMRMIKKLWAKNRV